MPEICNNSAVPLEFYINSAWSWTNCTWSFATITCICYFIRSFQLINYSCQDNSMKYRKSNITDMNSCERIKCTCILLYFQYYLSTVPYYSKNFGNVWCASPKWSMSVLRYVTSVEYWILYKFSEESAWGSQTARDPSQLSRAFGYFNLSFQLSTILDEI